MHGMQHSIIGVPIFIKVGLSDIYASDFFNDGLLCWGRANLAGLVKLALKKNIIRCSSGTKCCAFRLLVERYIST